MRDTTPEVSEMLAARYRLLTPAERLRMCSEMFDAARILVEASLSPGLHEQERHRQICERFYGKDFADKVYPK